MSSGPRGKISLDKVNTDREKCVYWLLLYITIRLHRLLWHSVLILFPSS